MKTEFDPNQPVWSTVHERWEAIALDRIVLDSAGKTLIATDRNPYKSTDLSTEEPSITHEQFMNVLNATPLESMDLEDVWEIVQECFKEVQKCTTTED